PTSSRHGHPKNSPDRQVRTRFHHIQSSIELADLCVAESNQDPEFSMLRNTEIAGVHYAPTEPVAGIFEILLDVFSAFCVYVTQNQITDIPQENGTRPQPPHPSTDGLEKLEFHVVAAFT